MTTCKAALVQLSSTDDPAENILATEALIVQAAAEGAELIATPEVTNIVSMSRSRQKSVLQSEKDDQTLARLRQIAAEQSVWCLIGSLALSDETDDGRFVNRSFLIRPDGEVAARYDKIHMFDAVPRAGEAYRESSGYRPGQRAVAVSTPWGRVGLTICYDMRFPDLFLRLARHGAGIITVPSAFTRPTGAAHWEVLLRARAIETGCFILAPAQCGTHRATEGAERKTWGHSLIVSPWGDVIADGGDHVGIIHAELDMSKVRDARQRVPSLVGGQVIFGP